MTRLNKTFTLSLKLFYAGNMDKNYLKALIISACMLLCSVSFQMNAQTLFEGFENCTETLNTYVPDDWSASSIVTNTDSSSFVNVRRVPALTEGQYALQITVYMV